LGKMPRNLKLPVKSRIETAGAASLLGALTRPADPWELQGANDNRIIGNSSICTARPAFAKGAARTANDLRVRRTLKRSC